MAKYSNLVQKIAQLFLTRFTMAKLQTSSKKCPIYGRGSRIFGQGLKLGHSQPRPKCRAIFLTEVFIICHSQNSSQKLPDIFGRGLNTFPFAKHVQKISSDFFGQRLKLRHLRTSPLKNSAIIFGRGLQIW